MNKVPSIFWIILTIVIGAGFLILLSSNKGNDVSSIIQNEELPVQVEVYSDYNCPHCADFSPFVSDVEEEFGEKVNLQKKHLPFLNDSSYEYAYAAEAAREQNKFDEFDKMLFKWAAYNRNPNNTSFEYSDEEKALFEGSIDTVAIARYLKLDIEKFNQDQSSQIIKDRVQNQKTEIVRKLGTQSTPTVLIYGKQFNLTAFEDLRNRVAEIINQIETK